MSDQRKTLLYVVYFVYFIGGLAQCFEGVFLPEFKVYFRLSYTEQMYTGFAKNIPFVCFSIAIGFLTRKIGFKNCLTISMFLFALGTWLIVYGLQSGNYTLVLGAFFIIGTGFNFGLVAGNPMLSALGNSRGSASRLNIGNALGAIAQIIAPLYITLLIPETVVSIADKMPYIQNVFVVTAMMLAATGVMTLFIREADRPSQHVARDNADAQGRPGIWLEPKVTLGFVAIFMVIGVEGGLFGLYRNYLEDPGIAGLSAHQSQQLFTVYFAVFALGRLVGSYVQKKIKPVTTLSYSLLMALLLLLLVTSLDGWLAVCAITALGFFASIFFPTLYAISIEGLGARTGQASGLLTMGFLGGAVIPLLQGKLADTTSLQFSFVIGIIPYLFALFFVWKGHAFKTFRSPGMEAKLKGL